MTTPIKTALIGAGFIGRVHAKNLSQNPDFDLAYVVDANEEVGKDIAARNGAEWLASPEQVFADPSIEAVWIATPPASHASLLRAASKSKKAIFCEKPLSPDMEEAAQLVAELEGYDKPVFLGFNRRFDPSHARLKQLIDEGAVGKIEMVVITSRDPGPPPVDYMRATPGGIFYDSMIHDFDIARWLIGAEPTELYATATANLGPDVNPDKEYDAATTLMKLPGGAICQLICSRRATFGYDQRIEVFGSKGMATSTNHNETQVVLANGEGFRSDPLKDFFTTRYAEAFVAELDVFARACRGEKVTYADAADGAAALRLSLEALKSAQEEKPHGL